MSDEYAMKKKKKFNTCDARVRSNFLQLKLVAPAEFAANLKWYIKIGTNRLKIYPQLFDSCSNQPPKILKMSKIIFAIAMVFAAIVVLASAQGGYRDLHGNFYDLTTGQVSSSLTGRVYNTVPHALPLAHYGAALPLAHHAYGYATPLASVHYAAAPLLFK